MIGLARGGPETAVDGLARLKLPAHHDVRAEDIDLRRLGKTLAAVADRGPEDFAELMLVPGVGARTLFALDGVAMTTAAFERGVEREWAAKEQLGGRVAADDRTPRQLGLRF